MKFWNDRLPSVKSLVAVFFATGVLCACSSVTDGETFGGDDDSSSSKVRYSNATVKSSSSEDILEESSSSADSPCCADLNTDSLLSYYTDWVKVPAGSVKRSSISFSVNAFEIGKTEVTQALYEKIMGTLPVMKKMGGEIPVANINWYEAVLFCNALSKKVGLDTAYVYESEGDNRYLNNLTIDYGVESIRLPSEMEWEVAYRGGTTTKYYWGTDQASEYAYYAQTSGPVEVGQYKPNAFGLYDMGGNVAEWVNDWFGSKPTKSQENYVGPEIGSAKVVRGGGWSDVAKVMAADSTSKKDPLYQGEKLGMRLVHSVGF